jgi:hypothetical protein
LVQLQRFHASGVRWREILGPTTHVLLQVQVQGVLLLLELETAVLEISIRSMRERQV